MVIRRQEVIQIQLHIWSLSGDVPCCCKYPVKHRPPKEENYLNLIVAQKYKLICGLKCANCLNLVYKNSRVYLKDSICVLVDAGELKLLNLRLVLLKKDEDDAEGEATGECSGLSLKSTEKKMQTPNYFSTFTQN